MIIRSKNSSFAFSSIFSFYQKKKLRSSSFDHRRDFSLIPHSQPQKFPPRCFVTNPRGNLLVPCVCRTTFFPFREKFFRARFLDQRKTREKKKRNERSVGKKGGKERVKLIVAIDPPIIRSWDRR